MSFGIQETKESATDQQIKLTGFATQDEPFYRGIIWETIEDRLPRGARARVRFHHVHCLPGGWSSWHLHNGPSFHLVLQGRVILERACSEPEYPDDHGALMEHPTRTYAEEYQAGQAFTEPVGIPHRAGNPDPSVDLVVVTFHAVEMDRHHIISLGYDRPDGIPS